MRRYNPNAAFIASGRCGQASIKAVMRALIGVRTWSRAGAATPGLPSEAPFMRRQSV